MDFFCRSWMFQNWNSNTCFKASHKTSISCVFFYLISDSLISIEVGNNWCMKRAGSTDVKRTGKEDRQITRTRGSHPLAVYKLCAPISSHHHYDLPMFNHFSLKQDQLWCSALLANPQTSELFYIHVLCLSSSHSLLILWPSSALLIPKFILIQRQMGF